MTSLQVRGLEDSVVEALRIMAAAKGKRGLETYVREVLEDHVLKPRHDFLQEIEEMHARVMNEHGGTLPTRSEDIIREDRETRG